MDKNRDITIIAMDVDGTLTDGKIYIGASGEIMKAFNVKDGLGIVKAGNEGMVPVIVTGRTSDIVVNRARELGVDDVLQGVADKVEALDEIVRKYSLDWSAVAFVGDDENDLDVMKACAFAACPADAVDSVKQNCDYVCKANGGEGAVREVVEYIIATRR
jgi:3-deoxy-D-manno-octulosonate 8-phosphate phosphatase (KDO 8-P phosphatase)